MTLCRVTPSCLSKRNSRGPVKRMAHTGNLISRASLASRDHNEQFHDSIVDLGAARLNDEDVLLADAGEDANAGFAIGKLRELGVGRLHSEVLAYLTRESRARRAREYQSVPHGGRQGELGRRVLEKEKSSRQVFYFSGVGWIQIRS